MQIDLSAVISGLALVISIWVLIQTKRRDELDEQLSLVEKRRAGVTAFLDAQQKLTAAKYRIENNLHRVTDPKLRARLEKLNARYDSTCGDIEQQIAELEAIDISSMHDRQVTVAVHKLASHAYLLAERTRGYFSDVEHMISAIDLPDLS